MMTLNRVGTISLISAMLALVCATDFARAQNAAAPVSAAHKACEGERDCLQKFSQIAKRGGNVLTLRLSNGKTKTLTDQREACEQHDGDRCMRYELIAYYPAQRAFVVAQDFYEGGRTILVSSRTGHETELIDEPHYSPSGKWIATVAGCDAYCDNGIDIWSATDPPKLGLRYRPKKDAYEHYEFVAWNGDDRLQMRAAMRVGTELRESLSIEAIRTPDGWRLTSPSEN